jgi:hypothetical protein
MRPLTYFPAQEVQYFVRKKCPQGVVQDNDAEAVVLPHWNFNTGDVLLLDFLRHFMYCQEVFVLSLPDIPCISGEPDKNFLVGSLKQVELVKVRLLDGRVLLATAC